MRFEQLRLDNQFCFPIYVASRLFVREYQPILDAIGITYPQYLVLMVLWEEDDRTVSEIAEKLVLNTNTITPLLKRMEVQDLIQRQRSQGDERKVIVRLTEKGRQLEAESASIPEKFISGLVSANITLEDLKHLKHTITVLIDELSNNEDETTD